MVGLLNEVDVAPIDIDPHYPFGKGLEKEYIIKQVWAATQA